MAYRNAPRAIGALLAEISTPLMKKRGFAHGRIVSDWPAIVGAEVARHSVPEKLAFPRGRSEGATLHVRVAGPFAVELQHMAPLVIERINRYFGYGAVAAIRLRQGVIERKVAPPRPRRPAPPDREREVALRDKLAGIEDGGLREALERLGREIPVGEGGGAEPDTASQRRR